MEASDRLRLFCALCLPDDALDRVTEFQQNVFQQNVFQQTLRQREPGRYRDRSVSQSNKSLQLPAGRRDDPPEADIASFNL